MLRDELHDFVARITTPLYHSATHLWTRKYQVRSDLIKNIVLNYQPLFSKWFCSQARFFSFSAWIFFKLNDNSRRWSFFGFLWYFKSSRNPHSALLWSAVFPAASSYVGRYSKQKKLVAIRVADPGGLHLVPGYLPPNSAGAFASLAFLPQVCKSTPSS